MELKTVEQLQKEQNIRFIKVHEKAIVPTKATDGACCYDLYSVEEKEILPQDVVLVKTGIKGKVPENFEVQVRPRSGLALKHKITVLNSPGTIDSDYLGEWGVILHNVGTEPFKVEVGMRIAQAKISACVTMQFIEVTSEEFNEINTVRGEGGYNSTGLK